MRVTNKSWKKKHPDDPIIAVYIIEHKKRGDEYKAIQPFNHIWSLTGCSDYLIFCRYSEYVYNCITGELQIKYKKEKTNEEK